MNQGMALSELASRLEHESSRKRDYITPASIVRYYPPHTIQMQSDQMAYQVLRPTNHAFGQITDYVGIPRKYVLRMRESAPNLLAENINVWLARDEKIRMVRTVDGELRAFVSDRYRRLDNIDLLKSVLPVLSEMQLTVRSSSLTATKMYLKFTMPRMQAEVRPGDIVEWGCALSNSEVGDGSVVVQPFMLILHCTNGMMMNRIVDTYHIGKKINPAEEESLFLTEETVEADDRAFWLKVRDTIGTVLSQAYFDTTIASLAEAAGTPITGQIKKVTEMVAARFVLTDPQSEVLFENLVREHDYTKWGLSNAVTAIANNTEDYEEATRLELIGGKIVNLASSEWRLLNAEA